MTSIKKHICASVTAGASRCALVSGWCFRELSAAIRPTLRGWWELPWEHLRYGAATAIGGD